jgi:ABC-type glutathione transport system ATPase component
VDDANRENEGDLVMAAEKVTAAAVAFAIKKGSGLLCLALTEETCDRLQLPLQTPQNTSRFGTAFTVSIEARRGVTSGISAADRARTVRAAMDPRCRPQDLARPGHILPLRARDVVMQGRLRGYNFLRPVPSRADREACQRALASAGAADLANHDLGSLSRGQRQRVMFARMLATEADLALLDEPTAAMDLIAARDAMDLLAGLAREHGIAVVMISHAHDVVDRHADDVLLLDRAAGQVVFGRRQDVLASEAYRRHLVGGDDDAS